MNTKTISLELAKSLHEACIKFGVKEIESEKYYEGNRLWASSDKIENNTIPAPDCSELGEVLGEFNLTHTLVEGEEILYFASKELPKDSKFRTAGESDIAECMGEMYLWLIINGYIK